MPGYGDPPKEYQFKKGQSGNPKGKPPGPLSKTIIAKWLASESDEKGVDGNPLKNFDKIVKAIIKKAAKGDVQAFEKLMDRLEGRPTQYLANDPENPLISTDVRERLAKRAKELANGSTSNGTGRANGKGS